MNLLSLWNEWNGKKYQQQQRSRIQRERGKRNETQHFTQWSGYVLRDIRSPHSEFVMHSHTRTHTHTHSLALGRLEMKKKQQQQRTCFFYLTQNALAFKCARRWSRMCCVCMYVSLVCTHSVKKQRFESEIGRFGSDCNEVLLSRAHTTHHHHHHHQCNAMRMCVWILRSEPASNGKKQESECLCVCAWCGQKGENEKKIYT